MFLAYEQVDCSGAAVQTSSVLTIPSGSTGAEIQAQDDGDINYTLDGSTQPGASDGMILQAGQPPKEVLIEDLRNIRFVKSGADTKLNIHYFGGRNV